MPGSRAPLGAAAAALVLLSGQLVLNAALPAGVCLAASSLSFSAGSPVLVPAPADNSTGDIHDLLAAADSLSQLDAIILVFRREGDFASLYDAQARRTRVMAEERELLLGQMDGLERSLGPRAGELAPCLLGNFLKSSQDRLRTLDYLLPFVESLEDSSEGFATWALAAGIVLRADGQHSLASLYFERAARNGFALAPHAAYLALESCAASREVDRMLALERRLEAGWSKPGAAGAPAVPAHVLRAARVATGVALTGSRLADVGRTILEGLELEDLSGSDEARVGLSLGRYFAARGDYARAAVRFLDAVQSGAGGPEVLAACDEYESLSARGLVRRELSESLSLADCLSKNGRQEQAARVLESAVRANQRSTSAAWELARLRYRMNDYAVAGRLFKRVESLERVAEESRRARLWFARCERQAGRTDVSVRLMRELAAGPAGAVAMEAAWELGFDLESLGRLDEASREYESLSRRFPASRVGQESLWRKGLCYYRLRKYSGARAVFSQVKKSAALSDLRDAAAFWSLKCDAASGKSLTGGAVLAELDGARPDSTGLYGAFLSAASRAEKPGGDIFLKPWTDLAPAPAVRTRPAAGQDAAQVMKELPQEFHNGAALLRLGLPALAGAELLACERELAGDREGLVLLAQLYWRSGLYRRGVLTAERLLADVGTGRGSGEARTAVLLRKITYPVCFAGPVYEQSRSQGVDPFLVLSVIKRESTFDPSAVSRAGAVGLMQLMPATARSVAAYLGHGTAMPDLTDPEVNIRYGVWHLGRLIGRYSDSVVAALAAYNAGEDNAERWLRGAGAQGAPADGFVYMESVSFRETRDYARRVLADLQTYRALY